MGLPAYIINRDELKQLIIQAVNTASVKVSLDGATLSGITPEIDFSPIEEKLDLLSTTIGDQSISTDTFLMTMNDIVIEMQNLQKLYSGETYKFSNIVSLILAENLKIKKLLQDILDYLSITGRYKTINLYRNLPASHTVFYLTKVFTEPALLSSIQISQDKYDFEDYWELRHNDEVIFNKVYSKYTTEKKNFASFRKISPSDTIEILFYNRSGKSKTINYDIDFLAIS
jgi:hypothetical protein